MNQYISLKAFGAATCAVAILLTGCATATPEQKGAGTGALIGAVAGQVLGRDAKSSAIGAGLGALGGYIWSKNMEDKKRAMEAATAGTGINALKQALIAVVPHDEGAANEPTVALHAAVYHARGDAGLQIFDHLGPVAGGLDHGHGGVAGRGLGQGTGEGVQEVHGIVRGRG